MITGPGGLEIIRSGPRTCLHIVIHTESLSIILRLTHIFSQRRPRPLCFSCRPLRLTSFPLPLAAFWCSSGSRQRGHALPSSLHLQGFNSQRYSARSNYLISSDAPRVICRSLYYTRFALGGRCTLDHAI